MIRSHSNKTTVTHTIWLATMDEADVSIKDLRKRRERYSLHFALVPGEALWVSCSSHAQLLSRVREIWGRDMLPLFKYFLPSHVEQGLCEVLVDSEEDFAIWWMGTGSFLDPLPLTDRLHVTDRRRTPAVLCSGSLDGMFRFPTLGHAFMQSVKCGVSLRHSASREVILCSRDDVVGEGCGEWGRLVLRARHVWNVAKPVLRYFANTGGSDGVKAISIYSAEDFYHWSVHFRQLQPELYVFEGLNPVERVEHRAATAVTDDSMPSVFVHHEVPVPPQRSVAATATADAALLLHRDLSYAAAKTQAAVSQAEATHGGSKTVAVIRPTHSTLVSAHESLVLQGAFGPMYSTPANVELRRELATRHPELQAQLHEAQLHHAALAVRLRQGY